ncbi:MAG: hypothetical protein R3F48_17985 [Candidatus Zixiibacteriota bacterium]
MDYGKIITTGFKQAWKYKSLWILGFLVGSGGGFNSSGNFNSGGGDFGGFGGYGKYEIQQFFHQYLPIIILVGLALLLLVLVFWILGTIANGALIDAARCFKNKEEYRLGKSWSAGARKFWPLFGLGLLGFVVIFSMVIILIGIAVGCFFIHVGIGIISLVFVIPLFIIVLFVAEVTIAIAKRMIVLDDKPVFDAIGDAISLWKSRLGPTLLYSLIYAGISLGVGIGMFIILIPVAIPLVAIGFMNIWAALIIGIPIVLLILLVVSGYTGASMHLMTTEFYFQLIGYEGAQPVHAEPIPGIYPPMPQAPTDHDGNPLPPAPPEQQEYQAPAPPLPPAPPAMDGGDTTSDSQDNRPPEEPRP